MLYHVIDPSDGSLHDTYLEWGQYIDGSIALRLLTVLGEPIVVPTICLAAYGLTPGDDEVFIRAYSQGVGWTNSLTQAGILELIERITFGDFSSPVDRCRLLVKPVVVPRPQS